MKTHGQDYFCWNKLLGGYHKKDGWLIIKNGTKSDLFTDFDI